jgi:hypothetical protein
VVNYDWLFLLGIALILYGVFCIAVGIFKIPAVWNMVKIERFKKLLGDVGTQIFSSCKFSRDKDITLSLSSLCFSST